MKKTLVSVAAGLIALSSAFATIYAKPVTPKVHPTLDMVAVSYNQVDNNASNFGAMPSPFDLTNGTVDSLVESLPTGHDYFWTLVQVAGIPKGRHTLVVKLVNPKGKVIATTTPDKFLAPDSYNDRDLTSSWKHAAIATGYTTFKVFLDGKVVGTAQYWG